MVKRRRNTNQCPLKFLLIVLMFAQLSLFLIGRVFWSLLSVNYASLNKEVQMSTPLNLKKTLSNRDEYLWLNSRLRKKAERMRYIQQIINVINRYQDKLSVDSKKDLAKLILTESEKYQYDPLLVVAMIMTESGFNSAAHSWGGARGLMQIRPQTGKEVAKRIGLEWQGVKSLHDPHFSIKSGLYYLREQQQEFGDLNTSLAAYNYGPTAIRRIISLQRVVPLRYAKKVMREYRKLKIRREVGWF